MNIFWFRRDLRLNDNAGLYHALKEGQDVLPVFIFDRYILDELNNRADSRVEFIHHAVEEIKLQLQALGSDLKVYYGKPEEVFPEIAKVYAPKAVYTNLDREPYALQRDGLVRELLGKHGIGFHTYKDHFIFDMDEVLKEDGSPYTVFTPYSKKWLTLLTDFHLKPYPTEKYFSAFHSTGAEPMIALQQMGFTTSGKAFPPKETTTGIIRNYAANRDIPAVNGTSRLSVHFRFGTVSIRQKAAAARALSDKWLNELIWRDFYLQIMAHFPHVVKGAFKPAYDHIQWRNNEAEFQLWCNGMTGYPIVDAGMRELNTTGFMHNRVRMIVACFLTKHLLIDWRWGEACFAEKLLDFELASNNGGWQWAAGCGVDAAPYFRVFNPYLQTERFDPQLIYIRQWVPEYGTPQYPAPMVEHTFARNRCLAVFKESLGNAPSV